MYPEGDVAGRVMRCLREELAAVDADLLAALVALADPVRLKIVLMLRQRERCVCDLAEALHLSQGTVSHHMGLLKRAGLVRDRRDPDDFRWVYYSLDCDGRAWLTEAIAALLDTSEMDPTPASCRDRRPRDDSFRRERGEQLV